MWAGYKKNDKNHIAGVKYHNKQPVATLLIITPKHLPKMKFVFKNGFDFTSYKQIHSLVFKKIWSRY